MKILNPILTMIVLLCTTISNAQKINDPCDLPPIELRKHVNDSIGNYNKTIALALANCLVKKEPNVDSNYILLAMAYLCDSITERNSHTDTLSAINNFKLAFSLNNSCYTANAIGNLNFALGPFPFDSAMAYYKKSVALIDTLEIGYRELSRILEAIADSSYKICSDLAESINQLSAAEEDLRRENEFQKADVKHAEEEKSQTAFNRHLDTLSMFYTLSLIQLNKCLDLANKHNRDALTYRKIKVAQILKMNEFKKTKDYSSAIPELRILCAQDDSLLRGNAFYFLGDIFEKNKEVDSAIANYERAVKADPDRIIYWESLLRAVDFNCSENDNCSAEKEEYVLVNLLRLDPERPTYYFPLGFLYDSLGFNDKKTALYTQAANHFGASQPVFTEWMSNYNTLAPEIEALEQQISHYPIERNKYAPVGPEYYQALRVLCFDYFKIDNFIKAGFIIEKLIHFYPEDDSLKMLLSSIYLEEDFLRSSLKLARKGKKQEKDFMDYKLIAFDLESKNSHMRSGWKYKKAIKQIKKLIQTDQLHASAMPGGPDIEELKSQGRAIYGQLANDLFKRKKYRKGKKFIERAEKEFPQ